MDERGPRRRRRWGPEASAPPGATLPRASRPARRDSGPIGARRWRTRRRTALSADPVLDPASSHSPSGCVSARGIDHLGRAIQPRDPSLRPARPEHTRTVARAAPEIDHAGRGLDCDTRSQVNRRTRSLVAEAHVLTEDPKTPSALRPFNVGARARRRASVCSLRERSSDDLAYRLVRAGHNARRGDPAVDELLRTRCRRCRHFAHSCPQ